MKFPAILSPKIRVLTLAMSAMLICTGAEGGCGGSPEPEIERPEPGSECPDTTPQSWDSCDLDEDQVCNYEEIICCDADGERGESNYATFAQCADGQWLIAMAGIRCEHGYWPGNCMTLTID
jgi:hypothetical protein